jgi:hypothetical protein
VAMIERTWDTAMMGGREGSMRDDSGVGRRVDGGTKLVGV